MQKKSIFAALCAALGFAGVAMAIQPPTITQPAPGILQFSWTIPTTRADGSALSVGEIGGYELYLTNEQSVISIKGGSVTSYTYTVPVGYTTKSTDAGQIMAVDTLGNRSAASAPAAMPVGVTTPKPLLGAPTALTVVRVPN